MGGTVSTAHTACPEQSGITSESLFAQLECNTQRIKCELEIRLWFVMVCKSGTVVQILSWILSEVRLRLSRQRMWSHPSLAQSSVVNRTAAATIKDMNWGKNLKKLLRQSRE